MYILMSDLKPSDFEPYTTYKKLRGELRKFYIELFKKFNYLLHTINYISYVI